MRSQRTTYNPSKEKVSKLHTNIWVYLSVKTCGLGSIMLTSLFSLSYLTGEVSVTGFYTENKPNIFFCELRSWFINENTTRLIWSLCWIINSWKELKIIANKNPSPLHFWPIAKPALSNMNRHNKQSQEQWRQGHLVTNSICQIAKLATNFCVPEELIKSFFIFCGEM